MNDVNRLEFLAAGEQIGRWRTILEDRHGADSYERLIDLLGRPCVTYAEIAKRFGVTRERVRQWHLLILPNAPRGHDRQRLCAAYNQKRRLLADPLFHSFYRHVRSHIEAGRIELIKASDGYRTRSVRIDDHVIALRDAGRTATARGETGPPSVLPAYGGAAEFVYFRVAEDDYFFLPKSALPPKGTAPSDAGPWLRSFRNTFEALQRGARRETA